MSFHRDRHSVLAGNLANLDTPGYQPLDLARTVPDPSEVRPLFQTDGHHLQPASLEPKITPILDNSNSGASGDGNGVNLELEMAKIAANRVRYTTATELVSRRLALIRYGATDGGG